jgi:hypothetical protein
VRTLAEVTSARLTAAGFEHDDPALAGLRTWNRAASERGSIRVEVRRGQFGKTRLVRLASAPDTPWNDPCPDPAHPDGPPVDDPEEGR